MTKAYATFSSQAIKNLEIEFDSSYMLISNKQGGIYIKYLTDEEVYQEQLVDLSRIIEDKINQMKNKYC